MARAVQRPAARRDFIIHYVYLAENAGLDVAKRFRQAVEEAYTQLAQMPGIGASARARQLALSPHAIARAREPNAIMSNWPP